MGVRKQLVKRSVDPALQKSLESHDLDSLLPAIYASRGVKSINEIHYTLKNLVPFEQLKGVAEASDVIVESLSNNESIVILGDFDVDGATATAVVYSSLKFFGAKQVNFVVPNRFKYSYGLSKEIVDFAVEKYNPALIITVDSGICDLAGVSYAKSLGIKVVITDHHLQGDELPEADAIVNPNLLINADFEAKSMAGVGVAFYAMLGVRAKLRKIDWFVLRDLTDPNMAELLDLVALGTIADVVSLDKNNRLMVFQGLLRIKKDKARTGIKALFAVAQRNAAEASAGDLAYALAPHLNAAGRLSDMEIGIKLLVTKDPVQADILADQLHDLNIERKQIEMNMQKQAIEIVNSFAITDEDSKDGLCLYQESWHQGVAGILASRLKEKYSCPVIILTKSSETELKGSARSVRGVDIRGMIKEVAEQHPAIVLKYGGHKNAAGLTIAADGLELFKAAFMDLVAKSISSDREVNVEMDGELPSGRLNIETAQMLREAGPWGQGFPEPLFVGTFNLAEQRIVGHRHLKLGLQAIGGYDIISSIHFNADLTKWPNDGCERVRILYRLDINEFRGTSQLQLVVINIEAVAAAVKAAPKNHKIAKNNKELELA